MKKKVNTLLFVGALAIATIFAVAHNAGANSTYLARYDTAHGNPSGTTSCSFCHVTTSPVVLNATGQTLLNSNFNYCSIGPATGTCAAAVVAPVISSFTATPASITSGQSSTLAWTLSGGAPTTLSINNSAGSVLGSTSRSVSPTTTTTYTITASNSAGSATQSVTVTVGATVAAPVISTFTATPASITSGQSSTLAWTLSGGAPTTLSINNSLGSVLGSTSRSVSPTTTTTYTITASNSAGSATQSVTVTVGATVAAPVISTFTATPASITSGQSSTLAWTLSGGAPTTLSINNSVGSVLGSTSRSVSPTTTTTYTITASNSAGNATRSVTVTVGATVAAPVISTFTATPASITSGQSSTLAWTLSGGAPTTLSINNSVGSVLGATSRSVSPTTTTTYTITASNSAGNATQSVTVTVTVTPPVIDGAALYAANCAGCHNPLASSAKRGRSATQIQNAISANRGGMGSLSGLTSAQVAAIATALASTSSDTTPPTVTGFSIPATSASTTVSINSFSATDNVGVTGYMVTESAAAPTASTAGWSTNPPATYSCSTTGARTLYAWARDAAGNVSASRSASTTVSGTPPVIDGAALYAANCAGCHSPLASSAKRGRSATQIQNAINNNTGGMGSLSGLTSAQIAAIATTLNAAAPPPAIDGAVLYAANCANCHGPLASSSKKSRSATQIQNAINNNVANMGDIKLGLTSLTAAQIQAIATALNAAGPSPSTDGAALYAANCAGCHGSLASSAKIGRTATQIQNAINNNTGGMGSLSGLTSAQIAAIAAALGQQTPLPPLPPTPITDGPTLYANLCASCHGPFASSTKRGRTAVQIQNAIYSDTGGMGKLSNLTYAQVQAIAAALTTDTTPPTVTGFSIPTTSTSLTVSITVFTATDNVGVTGYRVTESASAPSATASGWSTNPPAAYTCSTTGTKTLYAWAKDAAGNVSTGKSASVTITSTDTIPPAVTGFSIPTTSTSLTVSITVFTATDNVGVTGYRVTESAAAPSATAAGWSTNPPAAYTCSTTGTKTLYAWAKDAAGNVSASLGVTVTITASNPPTPSPQPPAVDLTIWPGQWLKVTMKYQGYLFGKSNVSGSNETQNQSDTGNPAMATDHENIAGYLKFVSWDPNQGVLQGELYQLDSQSGQWVSDPLALHLIGGSSTDFLCWTQVTGDFISGFVVRIQGKEKAGVLKSGTLRILGGYYFQMSGEADSSSAGSLAGTISINGSLVPEARVPVPK